MPSRILNRRKSFGFSLIELMICVAIVGVLTTIGFPVFKRHQMRAKSSEAKVNLAALRVAQESLFAEVGVYAAASPEPIAIPGIQRIAFDFAGSDFSVIGWSPEGDVYFSYTVTVTPSAAGFTAEAAADLDLDGVLQNWAYSKPDEMGITTNGGWGCDTTLLRPKTIEPCFVGNSIF